MAEKKDAERSVLERAAPHFESSSRYIFCIYRKLWAADPCLVVRTIRRMISRDVEKRPEAIDLLLEESSVSYLLASVSRCTNHCLLSGLQIRL